LHRAELWHSEGKRVRCELCSHRCGIADGVCGICGVRKNEGGILYSLNYGMLVASGVDPVEKKPLFHFQPGSGSFSIATAGCNFRCLHCQNYQISQLPRRQRGQRRATAGHVKDKYADSSLPGEYAAPETVVQPRGNKSTSPAPSGPNSISRLSPVSSTSILSATPKLFTILRFTLGSPNHPSLNVNSLELRARLSRMSRPLSA